jgi:hypothetical protein
MDPDLRIRRLASKASLVGADGIVCVAPGRPIEKTIQRHSSGRIKCRWTPAIFKDCVLRGVRDDVVAGPTECVTQPPTKTRQELFAQLFEGAAIALDRPLVQSLERRGLSRQPARGIVTDRSHAGIVIAHRACARGVAEPVPDEDTRKDLRSRNQGNRNGPKISPAVDAAVSLSDSVHERRHATGQSAARGAKHWPLSQESAGTTKTALG